VQSVDAAPAAGRWWRGRWRCGRIVVTDPAVLPDRQRLQARIYSGANPRLAAGTEKELARAFGVSRITIQKALTALHQEGLVDRQRHAARLSRPTSSSGCRSPCTDSWRISCCLGNRQDLDVDCDEIAAPTEIAERLGIPVGTRVIRVRRLRTQIEGIRLRRSPTTAIDIARLIDLDQLRTVR